MLRGSEMRGTREAEDFRRNALAEMWAGEACTLDGRPAKIMGRANRFATVGTLDPTGPAVQFSWDSVNGIMLRHGGRFQS